MPKVKVCFRSILSYVAFSVFVRIQGPWVNIKVGVKFLNGNT